MIEDTGTVTKERRVRGGSEKSNRLVVKEATRS